DTRNTTVYPPDFTNHYLVAWYRGDLRGILGEHGADALLVETRGALYEAAARDPAWTLAFESPVGSVFVPAEGWRTPPVILSEEPGPREFPGARPTGPSARRGRAREGGSQPRIVREGRFVAEDDAGRDLGVGADACAAADQAALEPGHRADAHFLPEHRGLHVGARLQPGPRS